MISKLTARTRNAYDGTVDKQIVIPFVEDALSPYFVKDFSGLGPIKAEISSFNTPLDPGGIYLSSREGERNIVLTVESDPTKVLGSTAEDLRFALYKVFYPTNNVELEFQTEKYGAVTIKGVVESSDPGSGTQSPVNLISIICTDPYFDDTVPQVSINVQNAIADFAAANPSAPFGSFAVDYDGIMPVGYIFDATFGAALPNGTSLYKLAPQNGIYEMISISMPIVLSDQVIFSTIRGNRYVNFIRSAATNTALPWFSGSLTDAKLRPGRQVFRFPDYQSAFNSSVWLRYKKRIGGL